MHPSMSGIVSSASRLFALAAITACTSLLGGVRVASGHDVKDLKYGVILFDFYQQKYFDTLVEYEYARQKGGIQGHGSYPELLKGGVSLSYGLDEQAKGIFSDLISKNAVEEVQNRAWYYLAKMLYLRGDTSQAAVTLSNIQGTMPPDLDQEYRYLAALVNIKLGYLDVASAISGNLDKHGRYAPFLHFNLGVALGMQKEYSAATWNLEKAIDYTDGDPDLDLVADRAHLAIAYLNSESNNPESAFDNINQVSTSGAISNRALLGSGWTSVNNGDYRTALTPLMVLQSRSMAIPEVQEAVLLIPHVYEKLGLNGRAADGFIKAYARYSSALDLLTEARNTLGDADMLELFVRNLDEILNDSDWFGTAPSVSLNSLSPFLIDLMSDHSFQSVLKDLRDLYAIRNNLESWKKRRNDFDVMLNARILSTDISEQSSLIEAASQQQIELQKEYTALVDHAVFLDGEERERLQWLLGDIRFEIEGASRVVAQLESPPSFKATTREYAAVLDSCMNSLDGELERTNVLIEKVEQVMLELVNAELNIHEERLKYYRVQSHLAKVRILDSSLADLEPHHNRHMEDKSDLEQEPESNGIQSEPSRSNSDAT